MQNTKNYSFAKPRIASECEITVLSMFAIFSLLVRPPRYLKESLRQRAASLDA